MKKVLGLMAIGLLLFGFAGQGMAADSLRRPAPGRLRGLSFGSTEVVIDLGHIGTTLYLSNSYYNIGGGDRSQRLHAGRGRLEQSARRLLRGRQHQRLRLRQRQHHYRRQSEGEQDKSLNNTYNPFAGYYFGLMSGGNTGIGSTGNMAATGKDSI